MDILLSEDTLSSIVILMRDEWKIQLIGGEERIRGRDLQERR